VSPTPMRNPCAAGSARSHGSMCTNCTLGKVALDSFHNERCELCAEGHYCPNETAQVVCDTGRLCKGASSRATQDALCPAGHFCNSREDITMTECEPNEFCPKGTTLLRPCPSRAHFDTTTELCRCDDGARELLFSRKSSTEFQCLSFSKLALVVLPLTMFVTGTLLLLVIQTTGCTSIASSHHGSTR
jgi:hypothetical protein